MKNKPSQEDTPVCKYCCIVMQADLDFPFGRPSSISIKTIRCPKCLWVYMVHTKEENDVWDMLERFNPAPPRRKGVGEDLEITHNARGLHVPFKIVNKECNCGDNCSCGSDDSRDDCGGGCGGCKH